MTLQHRLRIIRRLMIMEYQAQVEYRFTFLMYMVGTVIYPIIGMVVWRAASASGASLPMSTGEITTYFVALSVVTMVVSCWLALWVAEDIRSGNLNLWLCRPGSIHLKLIANNLTEKVLKVLPLASLVLLIWWGFRRDIHLPTSPGAWLLTALAMVLGLIINFALNEAIAAAAFWMDNVSGLVTAQFLLTAVLGGEMIPLVMIPEGLQPLVRVQPLRFIFSFPLEVFTGTATGSSLLVGFALQLGWSVVMVAGAAFLWRRGLRDYAAFGA